METKYKIGDKVWESSWRMETKRHVCPDCKDTRRWSAVSPAGNEYSLPCPRCSTNYRSYGDLAITYNAYMPHTEILTIGSIRTDTHAAEDERVSYMCHETGVGSGTIHYERRLHATKEEALAASEAECARLNSETPHIVERFNKSLSVSDYELSNALMESARSEMAKARYIVDDFMTEIEYCETMDEVRAKIEKRRNPESEPA